MFRRLVASVAVHPPTSRTLRRLVVASALLVGAVTFASSAPPAAAALASEQRDGIERIHGPITVIGDSVLQGSLLYAPTIVDRLAEQGWGPIRARAGVGYSTGAFSTATEARSTYWIRLWRQQGWDAPNVLVNLGANDSGRCDRNLQCARDAIMTLVHEIGPGHRIWWPMITRHPVLQHQADTWNLALQQIAAERPDFFTWDWPTVMATGGFTSPDNTHLSVGGYRTRSVLMAGALTTDLTVAKRVGGDAPLPVPDGVRSEVVPIGPDRVIDTREDPPGTVDAFTAIPIDVGAYVPDGTTAVAAYVSATNTEGPGFLTAYDCDGPRPLASAANYTAGDTRGAVAITPISDDGVFCLYTHARADLLVDLQAAFVPVAQDGLRFDALPIPDRLVDTRETGRSQILELEVPAGAEAVVVSLTAVFPTIPGFLTAYPCSDDVPLVATVNYGAGEVVSGTAFLPVGPDGTICVYALTATDVTVDLTGTFASGAPLVFQPSKPTRMADTRDGTGGWAPFHGYRQVIDAAVAPPDAVAVSGTITMVAPMRQGFTRAWDCGVEPPTANVTALQHQILANSVTTGVSDTGRLCLMSNQAGNTLFDTSGWWVVP